MDSQGKIKHKLAKEGSDSNAGAFLSSHQPGVLFGATTENQTRYSLVDDAERQKCFSTLRNMFYLTHICYIFETSTF